MITSNSAYRMKYFQVRKKPSLSDFFFVWGAQSNNKPSFDSNIWVCNMLISMHYYYFGEPEAQSYKSYVRGPETCERCIFSYLPCKLKRVVKYLLVPTPTHECMLVTLHKLIYFGIVYRG